MKLKIVGTQALSGCKAGFYIPSLGKMYTCPSVAKLAQTDLSLLKNLKVFRMPKNKSGSDKFQSVETWVMDVCERHIIFGGTHESAE